MLTKPRNRKLFGSHPTSALLGRLHFFLRARMRALFFCFCPTAGQCLCLCVLVCFVRLCTHLFVFCARLCMSRVCKFKPPRCICLPLPFASHFIDTMATLAQSHGLYRHRSHFGSRYESWTALARPWSFSSLRARIPQVLFYIALPWLFNCFV